MKETNGNGSFLSIQQAIEKMKSERGDYFSLDSVNLAEMERLSDAKNIEQKHNSGEHNDCCCTAPDRDMHSGSELICKDAGYTVGHHISNLGKKSNKAPCASLFFIWDICSGKIVQTVVGKGKECKKQESKNTYVYDIFFQSE